MKNRLIKTILFVFFCLCLCNAEVVKVNLHEEEIFEYSKDKGPLVFEINANLVKNKADFLMIEVESLTPRTDVTVFVSISGKVPEKEEDTDVQCSRYEYDVCVIPAELVKRLNQQDEVKVTFTVKCQNNCSFELFASYENYLPLEQNDEKILLVKEDNQLELEILVENTNQNPINTFILQVELLNPMEVQHYFGMMVFPKDSKDAVYAGDQLGSGQIKGVYEARGDKICKGKCVLTLYVNARKGSLMKINTYGYDKFRDIEPFKIYADQVESNSEIYMRLDLQYFKPISHVNLKEKSVNFQLIPRSGTCTLYIEPHKEQPKNIKKYSFVSDGENAQNVRVHYDDHGNEDHIYWIAIKSKKTRCIFNVKVDFVETNNQQIIINHPITGLAKQGEVEYFRLTLLGNHSQKIKVILHTVDNPLAELFVKMCKKEDDCHMSKKDIDRKTGFLAYSGGQSTSSKIVKINHIPEECPDFKPYNDIYDQFPSCTYMIGIYSQQGQTQYTIEATSASSYIRYVSIRENESFFDSVQEFEDNVYRFQVEDEVDLIKFVAKPQFGEIQFSAFFSPDGNIVSIEESTYAIQHSQWNEISFQYPKVGFYYLMILGQTASQYTLTPIIDRPETRDELQVYKLKTDIPHQVIKENSIQSSYFEINISTFEDQFPDLWIKLDQNINEYDVFITADKNTLHYTDNSKYDWSFTQHSKTDIHIDSQSLTKVTKKKVFVKVVPKVDKISQFFIIKYHLSYSYSVLEYNKPAKGHISENGVVLYKIPVSQLVNIQITKTVVNHKQNNVRLQIDFNEVFSGMIGFFTEYYQDIISIPAEIIQQGCFSQQSDTCFMYISVASTSDCDYQILINEQIDGQTIMAFDGYSNLLLAPLNTTQPLQVNYIIHKPEVIVITTQQVAGLSLCATIVNGKSQAELNEYPTINECQFSSISKEFYDHSYLKISTQDVEEHCKFNDHKLVCSLALSIYQMKPNVDNELKQKFRLSISSGMTELNKGKPQIGHAFSQNMEFFRYTSNSEFPIKIHVLPLDSSDLDIFVVFGEENRPVAFEEQGWSQKSQNFDDNVLEINTPLKIQNGSLQGVYIIGIYSKTSYSRFQISVVQETQFIQELQKNSVYSYKIPSDQSQYFEYTPNFDETQFSIKLLIEYGHPKIAVKKVLLGHLGDKTLPNILGSDYTYTNKYDPESDGITVRVTDCIECMYLIEIHSFKENSKFTLHTSSSTSQVMLYNRVYSYKFHGKNKKQELTYHAQETGYLSINVEYGEADVEIDVNGHKTDYKLIYFFNFNYGPDQDLKINITCNECSISLQTVKFDDLMTFKLGQIKSIVIEPGQEHKMQFAYDSVKQDEILKLNLMVENALFSDDTSAELYRPEVKIQYVDRRQGQIEDIQHKIHKFHESYAIHFKGKQGQYSFTIRWPANPKLKEKQDSLYIKAFMTANQSIFLQPYSYYSAHVQNGETTEIVQKKTNLNQIQDHELGIEIVVHVCSGKLNNLTASPYYRDERQEDQSVEKNSFKLITKNIFIYNDVSLDREIFIQLTAQSNNTFFNIHSQPMNMNQISLYQQIYLKDEQIMFDIENDQVNLHFDGVQIEEKYLEANETATIKYEVFFFKKVGDVQNQLCPQVDLLEIENDENAQENQKLESGLHLVTFKSDKFNQVEKFSVDRKRVLDQRNINDFYFTVQAQVIYKSQEAKLMYNIEKVLQISDTKTIESLQGVNYVLIAIVAASVIAIIFLIILVRRKMKYGLLPETHDVQLEQVGQQEVSSIKQIPNHVISPNMSVIQHDLKGVQRPNMGPASSAAILNAASSASLDPTSGVFHKNDNNA